MESIDTKISLENLCEKYKMTPSTFYRWREKFISSGRAGLSGRPTDRLKGEAKLKKMRQSKLEPMKLRMIEIEECPSCNVTFDSKIELEIHGCLVHEMHWLCCNPRKANEVIKAVAK